MLSAVNSVSLTVNSVLIDQIIVQTGIINGQLKTSAYISLQGASVTDNVWTAIGNNKTIVIDDVSALSEDIASLQDTVNTVFGSVVTLVGEINTTRQLV